MKEEKNITPAANEVAAQSPAAEPLGGHLVYRDHQAAFFPGRRACFEGLSSPP